MVRPLGDVHRRRGAHCGRRIASLHGLQPGYGSGKSSMKLKNAVCISSHAVLKSPQNSKDNTFKFQDHVFDGYKSAFFQKLISRFTQNSHISLHIFIMEKCIISLHISHITYHFSHFKSFICKHILHFALYILLCEV